MSQSPAGPPPTPLDYANVSNPRPRRPALSIVWQMLAALAVFALVVALLLPSLGRAREQANRIKCASNLRQIGMACIMYAGANGGQFPDAIGTLYANSDLTPEVFNCPSSDAARAVGPTTQATANLLQNSPPSGSSGHCQSYVYVGRGLTNPSPPNVVVAYDLPTNHPVKDGARRRGGNVLYADAHVEWHDLAELNAIAAAVQAGQNPPPAAATQPAER